MAYFLKVTLYCMCVSVVPVCVPCLYSAHAGKKVALEPLDHLELELYMVMSHLWVPGMELRPSAERLVLLTMSQLPTPH